MTSKRTLVRGGQVYDHEGDVHKPAVADILIEDDKILSIGANLAPMSCTKSSMHPDGWYCPGSLMRTLIRMMCYAAACSRSCRWKYGFFTLCRWEATAARTKCAHAPWWARWSACGAASPPSRTCWGFLRSPTNRPTSS